MLPSASPAPKPPAIAAYAGRPKVIRAADGSSARVTLSRKIKYGLSQSAGDDGDEMMALDWHFVGTSKKTFHFCENQVVLAEPDEHDFWTHHDNDNVTGPSPLFDYTSFGNPIRCADLKKGQSKSGLALFDVAKRSQLLVILSDQQANDMAEWVVKTR